MWQGLMVRRPVFPPSEHSSLSRKGSKGFAPGEHDKGKGISMPLYEHVFLTRQDAIADQVEELTAQSTGIFEKMDDKVVKTDQWGVKACSSRLLKPPKGHFTPFNVD